MNEIRETNPTLPFLSDYDEQGLKDATQRHQNLIDLGIPYEVSEAEARATCEEYIEMILDAKDAMKARGIAHANFPMMFNEFLRTFDKMKLIETSEEEQQQSTPRCALRT